MDTVVCAGPAGAIPVILDNGRCGLLGQPDDVAGLSVSARVGPAHRRPEALYSWHVMERRHLELCTRLARGGK